MSTTSMTDARQNTHHRINGDPKRELFFTHLGLVGYVVTRLGVPMNRSSAALERKDLVQFGVMGLLDAVERFDPERGVQFPTYAMSRIRGTIQDELRKLDWVPRSVRKKIRDAELMKIPYMLILGEKEQTEGTVSARKHGEGDIGTLSLETFSQMIKDEISKMIDN